MTHPEITKVDAPNAIRLLEHARTLLAQTLQILDEVMTLVKPLAARTERLERLTADQGADIADIKQRLDRLESARVA
jgi:hypothetical protein